MRHRLGRVVWLGVLAVTAVLLPASGLGDEALDRDQINRLVRELGAADFQTRQAAEKGLIAFGPDSVSALELAAQDPDPEVAERAKRALVAIREAIAARTHQLLDAEGKPIGGAALMISVRDRQQDVETKTETTKSDAWGYVSVHQERGPGSSAYATVSHPRFGRARVLLRCTDKLELVTFPLVDRDSAAHERALRGRIVDPEGNPVANAAVSSSEIRTPGEGLISSRSAGAVLTDDQGRFALYPPPNAQRRDERGELIPPNSRFHLVVRPVDDALFPWAGEAHNTQEAKIVLQRPTLLHIFKFEGPQGVLLESDSELRAVQVGFSVPSKRRDLLLDSRYAKEGGKLLPGVYWARYEAMDYLPIEVREDSPKELVFRFPRPVTYRGRVTDGVSEEPFANAFVMAMRAVAHNNLALLTDAEWGQLEALPPNPPADSPALKRLRDFYGLQAVVRTDAEGRYMFTDAPGTKTYGLIAFARGRLPYKCRVAGSKADEDGHMDLPDLPLYPAAKVLVRPVKPEGRVSVGHRWVIGEEDQPAWVTGFRRGMGDDTLLFERLHWLTLNEKQPLYVPAGLHFGLVFTAPYDEQWTVVSPEKTLLLEPGEEVDIGDVTFLPSARITVTVVDDGDKPVEGIPLRRKQQGSRSWSVTHNTDVNGEAGFFAPSGSSGEVGIRDFPDRGMPEANQSNLVVPFQVGEDGKLVHPCVIRLTAKQRELLLGGKK